nr:hypothetical protein [Tanacetum cinerariifolium]
MSRQYTSGPSGTNSGKQRVIVCYNCKGEGQMSKQYTEPKRKRDKAWFKDKVLLVQAQVNGQVLHEEELEFLADPWIAETQSTQITSLADKAILLGADNRPPMLEKDMYDSWKSIMELYMLNRQHGRMILESVENGPFLWPTVEENGVTRPKKYS